MPNHRHACQWDSWINPLPEETVGIHLPQSLLQKAKKVN
jgi:hypothetical protein